MLDAAHALPGSANIQIPQPIFRFSPWNKGEYVMKFRFSCALIVAASLAGPVVAQTAAEPSESVTVFAPYVVKKDKAPSGVQTVRSRGKKGAAVAAAKRVMSSSLNGSERISPMTV